MRGNSHSRGHGATLPLNLSMQDVAARASTSQRSLPDEGQPPPPPSWSPKQTKKKIIEGYRGARRGNTTSISNVRQVSLIHAGSFVSHTCIKEASLVAARSAASEHCAKDPAGYDGDCFVCKVELQASWTSDYAVPWILMANWAYGGLWRALTDRIPKATNNQLEDTCIMGLWGFCLGQTEITARSTQN